MRQKTFENLTGCVMANFVSLHYNEEIKQTIHYKHNLKRLINPLIRELQKIEKSDYDTISESVGGDLDTLTENYLEFIKLITKGSFKDFMTNQNLLIAAEIDSKRMSRLANKIIEEHNKKQDEII